MSVIKFKQLNFNGGGWAGPSIIEKVRHERAVNHFIGREPYMWAILLTHKKISTDKDFSQFHART